MNLLSKLWIGCIWIGSLSFVTCSLAQPAPDSSRRAGDTIVRDTIPPAPKKKGFFNFLAPHRAEAAQGKLLITPFLFPGYSPDIQYSLAGGAIFSFKTNKKDSLLPRSSVPVTITYSTINSFIASAGWITFWLHDKLRIYALTQYKAYNDAYYGVGYENGITTAFPDSTKFRRSFFIFRVQPLWRVRKSLYAGLSLDFNQNILWNVNPHIQKDPYYLQAGQYIVNTGIGGMVTYDTRDVAQNPYKGIYSALIITDYTKSLGGNQNFQSLDFDNRLYLPLSATKVRTLAINLRSRYDYGQAPFTSMISLGTSQDLRGMRFGQFRDYYMNYLVAEYRYKFYKPDGKPTRFGFVLFSGIGSIGDNFSQAAFQRVLPDFGVGLRFEVQPRLNLRVDFGYAPNPAGSHTATYFNFLESY